MKGRNLKGYETGAPVQILFAIEWIRVSLLTIVRSSVSAPCKTGKSNTVSSLRGRNATLYETSLNRRPAENTLSRWYSANACVAENVRCSPVACISNEHSKGRLSAKFPTDEPKTEAFVHRRKHNGNRALKSTYNLILYASISFPMYSLSISHTITRMLYECTIDT